MTEERFNNLTFADNPDPRAPLVVIIDKSESMGIVRDGESASPMESLTGSLDTLVTHLMSDKLARRRVEVSFVTYSTKVDKATPFSTVDDGIIIPDIQEGGITSTGSAVLEALEAVEYRKKEYKENGVEYFRPWVLLITDGLSTDDIGPASQKIKEMEESKGVAFFAVGVDGADMGELQKLSYREPLKLKGVNFPELFAWLSASQSAVSGSNPGDRVPLPAPSGWAEV